VKVHVLAGLPGDGPPPLHLHRGHPTPWTEQHVVRLALIDGSDCVVNCQFGNSSFSDATVWLEAQRFILVACGALYLVSALDPTNYVIGPSTVTSYLFSDERDVLLIADYADLSAYDTDGTRRWHNPIGVDGVEPTRVDGNLVLGRVCVDPGTDHWRDFRIRLSDGTDA
jgi:hypothetical protein